MSLIMGDQRSEMCLASRRAKEEREQRERMTAKIRKAIKKEGIEYVLADIIRDPTMASIHFH